MSAVLILLVACTFVSSLVAVIAAFRFSFSYRRWQQATGRTFSWKDPARSYEYLFYFLGPVGEGDPQPGPELRRKGLRHGKIALVAGGVFAALVLATMLVGEVS